MSAYVVIEANVRNREARDRYAELATPILKEFGGETVAFGPWQALFGESDHRMGMILQFATKDAALAWYESPAYQAILGIRDEGLDARFRLLG